MGWVAVFFFQNFDRHACIIIVYLVAHPTARKWVITPVINGIFVGLIHS